MTESKALIGFISVGANMDIPVYADNRPSASLMPILSENIFPDKKTPP
jgi:hypothetical protein